MKDVTYQDVVLKPVVTEKTLKAAERTRAYTFRVRDTANKVQIRHAIEHLFKVHVTDVRTQWVHGKRRRLGRHVGMTPAWKRAVVRLREGDTIDFY